MKPAYEKVPIGAGRPYQFWRRTEPVFPFEWHYHPEFELTLITCGEGTRVIGDDVSDYQAGDFVLLGPNLPHTWASRNDIRVPKKNGNSAVVFQFTPELFGNGILQQAELAPVTGMLEQSERGIRFSGEQAESAARLLEVGLKANGLRQLILLYETLELLTACRDTVVLSSRVPTETTSSRPQVADRLYEYINQHCLEHIDITEAASHFNMTANTFHRQLKRTTGRTLTQLVNELRISHACSLLTRSDRTIAEICYQCGYQNLSYFNRKFLEYKKMTPREYRRQFVEKLQ